MTPRSLLEASARNVYGDPSKVTPELVDRYVDMIVCTGNRRALGQRFAQVNFGADAGRIAPSQAPDADNIGRPRPPGSAGRRRTLPSRCCWQQARHLTSAMRLKKKTPRGPLPL